MGSGLYMVASQGGSPSGRLTAVRGRSSSPDLVPGRMFGEAVAPALPLLPDGFLAFVAEPFRPVAVVSAGDDCAVFGLDFVGDEPLDVASLLKPFVVGTGVVANESSSSRGGELSLLSLRFRVLKTGMPSSGLILLLIVRFLIRGVSRSIFCWGIGRGLDVSTGILDPDFLNTGCEYICDGELSAAISSGVRKSQFSRSSSSSTASVVRDFASSVSPRR